MAKDKTGLAVVGSGGVSTATATSTGQSSTASADSSSGGHALAVTGRNAVVEASVPNGQQLNETIHRAEFAIAWNADGSFSVAEVNGNIAQAWTGSTTDTGALASGNLKAFMSTATFAEAYASPTFAWASAFSSASGESVGSAGFAVASGSSYAFASVTHLIEIQRSSQCSGVDYKKTINFKKKVKSPRVWDCNFQPYVGVVWHPKG